MDEEWKKLEVTLRFTGDELQNLLNGLAQLPYAISAQFIHKIQQQSSMQFQAFDEANRKGKEQQP